MTIPATVSEVSYLADGITTAFPIPFVFDTSADIKVISTDEDGDPTVITTGFSITGGAGSTGTCTFDDAPDDVTITILDDPAITQPTDYPDNDAFPASAHEAALDRTVRQVKRLHQRVERTMRVRDGDRSAGDDLLLPLEAARAGLLLGFDAEGNPVALSGAGGADSALRTDLASAVASSDGARLVGFRRTEADSVALSVFTKLSNIASTLDFGASAAGTAAANRTAILNALSAADIVQVVAGEYAGPIDISGDDKTLLINPGVTIKLPDGTVSASDITGPHVLDISGDNCTIVSNGNLRVDGNWAENDATDFVTNPATDLSATLHISGSRCRIVGFVKVKHWYWRGVVIENGNDTGDEVVAPRIDGIEYEWDVDGSGNFIYDYAGLLRYALMAWTVKDYWIGEIIGVTPDGWHTRLRWGSQSADTGECLRGTIGAISGTFIVVTESNTDGLDFGDLNIAGGKYEDSARVRAKSWNVNGALLTEDYLGPSFAMIGCEDCDSGPISVTGHNQTLQAVAFTQANVNCRAGNISVRGTTVAQKDLVIGENDGLMLGNLELIGGAGATHGLDVQYDADSKNITIGDIDSRGHATEDITIASNIGTNAMLRVRSYNKDAVTTIGSGHGRGTFTWTTGTASQVITDPHCRTTSIVHLQARDADAGVVMHGKGFYVTPGAGSFTIATGDASTIAGNSDFSYVIQNAL